MIYPGLAPSNPSKDAKYSVVSGEGGYEVRLVYRVSSREVALLTTGDHDELVDMVNTVKTEVTGQPGGAFYINEFRDVLVPGAGECHFAGIYEDNLAFDFDGPVISPEAPADLEPGDEWLGPHVGIRYTLAAGGRDIRYELKNGNRILQVKLSDEVGAGAAASLAARLASVKGSAGGRIYINESSEFFAPPSGGGSEFLYLGSLGEDAWFPAPDVPGRD